MFAREMSSDYMMAQLSKIGARIIWKLKESEGNRAYGERYKKDKIINKFCLDRPNISVWVTIA